MKLFLLTILTSTAFLGCSSDESTTVCGASDPCLRGYECVDQVCLPELGDVGRKPIGNDVGVKDTSSKTDVTVPKDLSSDVSSDVSQDTGPISYPSPSASTHFDPNIPFMVRDASENGTGIVVVGTTTANFEVNENREAVAFHFDSTGVKWALRFGDPLNDQFATAATDGTKTVLAGLTRGYSTGAANNNDVLIVEVDETGMVGAASFGTLADEFILNIFPGGQLAKWIGVGEYRNGGPRDGLVVGFDLNLLPIWSRTIDVGGDDFLSGGVVVGNALYVVGNTELAAGGDRRAFVARMTPAGVTWARQSTKITSTAVVVYASKDGAGITVAGRIDGSPSTFDFTPAGDASGTIWGIRNGRMATGITFGTRTLIHGIQDNGAPFIFSPDDDSPSATVLSDGLQTSGYLLTPIAELDGEARLFVQTNDFAVVDIPFSLTPEASCVSGPESVSTQPLPGNAFESVDVTESALIFSGGPIPNIRRSVLIVGATADACGP